MPIGPRRGFLRGSIVSQELALRHPELVRSLVPQSTWPVTDAFLRTWLLFVRRLVEVAPTERAFLDHDTSDRLAEIAVPTLVLAGWRDSTSRPRLGRAVADSIPGASFWRAVVGRGRRQIAQASFPRGSQTLSSGGLPLLTLVDGVVVLGSSRHRLSARPDGSPVVV